jgi:hypothetical protein
MGVYAKVEAFLSIHDHKIEQTHISDGSSWDGIPAHLAPIFTTAQDTPSLRTYMVIDANLRREHTKLFDLDVVDVPVMCLFSGAAAEDYAEAAPYIADVTLDGEHPPPQFIRTLSWPLAKTGIFVQSEGSLQDVRAHLRHFTLLTRDGHKGRFFFRFWDPLFVELYLTYFRQDAARVTSWCAGRTCTLSSVFAVLTGKRAVRQAVLQAKSPLRSNSQPAFKLTEQDLDPYRAHRFHDEINRIAATLRRDFEYETRAQSDARLYQLVSEAIRQAFAHGLGRRESIYYWAVWSVLFGATFERFLQSEHVQSILSANESEEHRITALKHHLSSVG